MLKLRKENAEFGKRLRILRTSSNLAQDEMAEKLGIRTNYIADIECGVVEPTVDIVIAVALEFGVSCDWLLLGLHDDDSLALISDRLRQLTPDEMQLFSNVTDMFLRMLAQAKNRIGSYSKD